MWSAGVQYRYDIDKKKLDDEIYAGRSLIFGLYGNNGTDFYTSSTVFRIRENYSYSPIQSDTLLRYDDLSGSGKLPAEFTIGIVYEKGEKFRAGFEYGIAKWSEYENDAKPDVLFDSRRIAVGIEFIPDKISYNNYLKRIRYRVGFYYSTDPRLEDLNHYALTLGFGLPLILPRQQTSFVNLAFELGQYNTDQAIKETFVKIGLGFTLNDSSWFFKRKFG